MHALPSQQQMYEALVRRDRAYNGIFFIGVRTTGIFCRPTCPAKKPRPENVEYFPLARDADLGRDGAHRAIGRANGLNRIAIVIPCHRVVRSDGTLRGYGGGVWRKRWLLEHEKR